MVPGWIKAATRRPELLASVMITVIALVDLLSAPVNASAGVTRRADGLAVALLVVATAALTVARRYPRTAVGVGFAGALCLVVLGYGSGIVVLAPVVALGVAAGVLNRRDAIVTTALAMIVLLVAQLISPGEHPVGVVVGNLAIVLLAALLGAGVQAQQRVRAMLEARTRELQALRDVETRDAVVRERLRIAREVHDVVGHSLAAIALHAQIARRRLAGHPERVDASLVEIVDLVTGALGETREAVGLIRDPDERAELHPRFDLDDVDELVAGLVAAGVEVEVRREGNDAAPSRSVQAAAYRIVQEALSNVVKHTDSASASVLVRQHGGGLVVEIRDSGVLQAAGPAGNGVRGMRERAHALDGSLEAGPAPDGGWLVRATLPSKLER